MEYYIENAYLRYGVDGEGRCVSFYNKETRREYISAPAPLWRLIYSVGQRAERPVFAAMQTAQTEASGESMTMTCRTLNCDDGSLDITLSLTFRLDGKALSVTSKIENRSDVTVAELLITAASGIHTVSGDPARDSIMWPARYGKIIPDPARSDLSVYSGFRKYERHDYLHTDLDLLYPGGSGSMPWYDLYSSGEGIYVGSHDTSCRTVCLHAERNVKTDLLSLGVSRYPFAGRGDTWEGAPIVYQPHTGDWRSGARVYRAFAERSGYFKAPALPGWVRNFEGWLRVILKPHHCEINWDYSQIPALYDGAAAAGLDTIFLLGWERGGFARMWPDFVADDTPRSEDSGSLGSLEELKAGIEYVHSRGGHVIMFLSYFLIDHKSDFYLHEGGDECTIKSIWGEDVPFAETYCGEATYRKLPNPPMPMYGACPGSGRWHEKMTALADYCLSLGADGVLYDLGGLKPYLCFAKGHDHKTPDTACASKAARFADLRRTVKSHGEDKIILMEHMVDCFNQHMDITHGSLMVPASKTAMPDMYRYTFPELVLTNRELGEDEKNYRDNINFTFIYGLAFDMTVYRCCGSMEDVPRYAEYMKKIIELRKRYAKYLHEGSFIGDDGFSASGPVRAKAYRAADGSVGVALWNTSHEQITSVVTADGGGEHTAVIEPDGAAFMIL